jgi:hypothetical protein
MGEEKGLYSSIQSWRCIEDSTTKIEQSKCMRLDREDQAEQDKEDLTQKNAAI